MTQPIVEKRIEYGGLFEIYGALLTPRQRECMRLFYLEDITAPEIAAHTGVSRQAVHETLRSAEAQLAAWEKSIRALEWRSRMEEARELLDDVSAREGADSLEKAKELLEQEVTDIGV